MIKWIDALSDPAATLVGSAIGIFGGLIAILLGALFNAHLNRVRDDRILNDEKRKVATVFHEELKIIHHALVATSKQMRSSKSELPLDFDFTRLIRMFRQSMDKLALLNSEVISIVIRAYTFYETFGQRMRALGTMQTNESTGESELIFPLASLNTVADVVDSHATAIKLAVDAMDKQLKELR